MYSLWASVWAINLVGNDGSAGRRRLSWVSSAEARILRARGATAEKEEGKKGTRGVVRRETSWPEERCGGGSSWGSCGGNNRVPQVAATDESAVDLLLPANLRHVEHHYSSQALGRFLFFRGKIGSRCCNDETVAIPSYDRISGSVRLRVTVE